MLNMITLIYYCHFVKGHFNTRKEGDYDLRKKGLTFPEQFSWPSYTNITPCPLLRLNVLFCFQFKPVKSTSRQSQNILCTQRMRPEDPVMQAPKVAWPWPRHTGREIPERQSQVWVKGSNRKPSASWQLTSSAVPSAQPWERDGGGRSARPLPHCLSAFPSCSGWSYPLQDWEPNLGWLPSLSFSHALASFLSEYVLSCTEILFSGSTAGESNLWHLRSKEYPWIYLLKLMLRFAVMIASPVHEPRAISIIVAMAPPWSNLGTTGGNGKGIQKFWEQPLQRQKLSKHPI